MIVIREKIIPPILPNAAVNKIYVDGVHTQFEIIPDKGFKLHDARLDTEEFDEEMLEFTGRIIKGFKTKEYIAKKKVFEDKFNLKITEI